MSDVGCSTPPTLRHHPQAWHRAQALLLSLCSSGAAVLHCSDDPSFSPPHTSSPADDGTYSGTDEALFIKKNLMHKVNVTDFDLACNGGATRGTVMGQPIMVM